MSDNPWNPGRYSLADHLRCAFASACELPDEALLRDLRETPLHELAARLHLFREHVTPVVAAVTKETDVVAWMMELLTEYSTSPSLVCATRLYQLFIDSSRYNGDTCSRLSAALEKHVIAEDPIIRGLLVGWLEQAPDRNVLRMASFILCRHRGAPPPVDLILTLGRSYHLVLPAGALVINRYPSEVAEDVVIGFAKGFDGVTRTSLLEMLTVVRKPENRDWLLTEGYDNGKDYDQSAYAAAVLGGLVERLRQPRLGPEALFHHARALSIMGSAFGVVGDLFDYADGPEAVSLLLDHLESLGAGLPESLEEPLVYIYWTFDCLWDPEAAAQSGPWTPDLAAKVASRARALLDQCGMDPDRYWWQRPKPTLADLRAGNLTVLHDVVNEAEGEELEDILAWATEHLQLNAPRAESEARRLALLGNPWKGVALGGLAGVTDPVLKSEYGQVLLQPVLRLRNTGLVAGRPLIRAALDSGVPMLQEIAATVLANWPGQERMDH